jgi:hypothetical protein
VKLCETGGEAKKATHSLVGLNCGPESKVLVVERSLNRESRVQIPGPYRRPIILFSRPPIRPWKARETYLSTESQLRV